MKSTGMLGRLLFVLLLPVAFLLPAVSRAQPVGWERWLFQVEFNSSLYVSPADGRRSAATVGPGFNIKGHVNLHPRCSFGLLYEELWLYPEMEPHEFDVRQEHFFFFSRLTLVKTFLEVSVEAGFGTTNYSGMVDIPDLTPDEYCFGCGRYGGGTGQWTIYTGAVIIVPLHRFIVLQAGARYMHNFSPDSMSTDAHNFIPAKKALGFDLGVSLRM
jgi:hypothetical protein